MTDDEYVELDGLGLAERVAAGEVSAGELQQLARARTDKLNPRINAISLRIDDRADRQAAGPLSGPFAGVPFLWDLNQDIEGVPTSAGCRALAGRPAISLPLYWTPDGLPLGIQFVGRLLKAYGQILRNFNFRRRIWSET